MFLPLRLDDSSVSYLNTAFSVFFVMIQIYSLMNSAKCYKYFAQNAFGV